MGHRVVLGLLLFWSWGFASAFMASRAARADEPAAAITIDQARVGIGGHYKAGCWTPVAISLTAPPGPFTASVEIEAVDSDGVPVIFRRGETAKPLEVGADGRLTVSLYGRFGRLRGDLATTLRDGEKVIAKRRFSADELAKCWPPGQSLLVELGPSWNAAEGLRGFDQDSQLVTIASVDDADALPNDWFGWEGIDAVVLSTTDPAFIERLGERQFAALDRWLRLGGRLLWCVGSRGGVVFGPESRFATWSPGKFVEVGVLRRASAFETYAGTPQRLEFEDADRRPVTLDATLLDDVHGRIESPEGGLSAGDRPLIVRYSLGLGQATLVTVDMDRPPMVNWAARSRMVGRIVQRGRDRLPETNKEQVGQVTHFGFDDLAGQLRGALDQYSGATLVAFSWVASLVVVYLLLLGPGDYFLLRYFGRPHWTWGTLGLMVVTFAALTSWLSASWKEPRLRVNQAQVVDFDVEGQFSRGISWANIYSPTSDRFQLALRVAGGEQSRNGSQENSQVAAGDANALLAWQGLPGKGMGGLSANTLSTMVDDAYQVVLHPSGSVVDGLPIPVAGTKSLVGRWWRKCELKSDGNRLSSVSFEEQLQGECVYPLDRPLTDWYLVYGNWLYRGDRALEPGDTISIDDFSVTRYLDWHLTRRRVTSEHKDVSTPWDRAELDVPRIVEMLMFHEAAGGQVYTRLQNRYQGFVDLSEPVPTRASRVGGGVATSRLAELGTRRQDRSTKTRNRSWTFVRVVYPVKIRKAAPGGNRATGPVTSVSVKAAKSDEASPH
jgi:hypothetical protein